MDIIDPHELIPNKSVINEVIMSHPCCHVMMPAITNIHVEKAETESIIVQGATITLFLQECSSRRDNFRYVLFHELYHVADRLNPEFEFDDNVKQTLATIEGQNLMELWNLFIDARLHKLGLFELDENDRGLYGTVNGKLQEIPFTIEGKQLRHISFLASRGVPEAENLVRRIWTNPPTKFTYRTLANLAKGQPAGSDIEGTTLNNLQNL
jgi:hypothetical protein